MRYLISIALLTLLILPAPWGSKMATQQPAMPTEGPTGNDFLRECNFALRFADGDRTLTAEESEYGTHCMGYLLGFLAGYGAKSAVDKVFGDTPHREVCFPEFLPTDQMVRTVVKYLREHPERLQQGANLLVIQALYAAFPCK
jgi:Ssp1 endopeptidase immunity protein Rap1a